MDQHTPSSQPVPRESPYLVIGAVIVGITAANAGFYTVFGETPPSGLARPVWTPLALGGFALALAWKEQGAARLAFLVWTAHQGLIAFTFLGFAGWVPWLLRSAIMLSVAGALIVSALPISSRDRWRFAAVLVAAIAVSWVMMWSGRELFQRSAAGRRAAEPVTGPARAMGSEAAAAA